MKQTKSDLLQGTLDLLILRTLAAGDMHGWGIAQRLQQISQDVLQVNQGSLYPALYRLEQEGWIAAAWGDTENNRRAKYYSLTKSGTGSWPRKRQAGSASPPRSRACCSRPETNVMSIGSPLGRLRGSFRDNAFGESIASELRPQVELEAEMLAGRDADSRGTRP